MSVVPHEVEIGAPALKGLLGTPEKASALVIFAHGSGSGRLSPRNNYVAEALRKSGLATLVLDLLMPEEELRHSNVFDIPLLAKRLLLATAWARDHAETAGLPIGYFGASTGAGAALVAAADNGRIFAVVSRGGRPDLAGDALERVRAPTLLIVGGHDYPVIGLNREAQQRLKVESELVIVPGATHLFEEPGALDQVIAHASRWFLTHLPQAKRHSA
jgi:putative phosphoribosyl transferase